MDNFLFYSQSQTSRIKTFVVGPEASFFCSMFQIYTINGYDKDKRCIYSEFLMSQSSCARNKNWLKHTFKSLFLI